MISRLLVLLSLVCSLSAWGADNTSLEQLVPPIPDWIEGRPDAVEPGGDWDWLQLDTHEWLKGEIIALYDDTLEFESDKFGVMSIGWSDVIELRSGRLYRIGLDQGEIDLITSMYDYDFGDLIIGRLYINREKAYISGDLGQQWTLERSEILTITSGNPIEANLWSLSATVGITIDSGNTESESTNIFLNANRRDVNSRVLLDYTGIVEETNNDETANNHRLRSFYDIFQTKNFFYRPVFLEFYRDDFQNLDYRVTYSPGLGFYLVDSDTADWDVTIGPIYKKSRFASVEAGANKTESSAGWGVVTTANIDVTPDIEWYLEYTVQTADERTGGDTQRFLTRLNIEINSQLKFDVSYMLDHVENPIAGEDGITPDNTDTRLMFGIVFDY